MKQQFIFSLDSTNPKKTFNCKYGFSGLRIKRMQIPFLSTRPTSEWVSLLDGLQVHFKSTSTDGSINNFPLDLSSQLTPYHQHPIFELDLFVPKENENNMKSLSPFADLLEVKLVLNKQNSNNLIVVINCEEYPIVSEQ